MILSISDIDYSAVNWSFENRLDLSNFLSEIDPTPNFNLNFSLNPEKNWKREPSPSAFSKKIICLCFCAADYSIWKKRHKIALLTLYLHMLFMTQKRHILDIDYSKFCCEMIANLFCGI